MESGNCLRLPAEATAPLINGGLISLSRQDSAPVRKQAPNYGPAQHQQTEGTSTHHFRRGSRRGTLRPGLERPAGPARGTPERLPNSCGPHAAHVDEPGLRRGNYQSHGPLRARGVKLIIRVIPDPSKDIGFGILSRFHYPNKPRTVICETLSEAAKHLKV
jgi:hypothetical protein